MSHELVRLRSKLCNTPHLVTEDMFGTILEYLDARNKGEVTLESNRGDPVDSNYRYNYNRSVQVATMNIEGPTSYKPVTIFGMDCGGFSYEQWKEDFQYLAESGAKTVAFLVDSGGGEAYGCFDSARYVRSLADQYGINLLAYVDGTSASAAYAITSIADEIILGNGAEVGSIGVLVRLMNDSKHLEQEGYERTFITYGGQKVPFNAEGNFRKEFIEDIQYKVDLLGQEFIRFVAENRNLSEEAVRQTQAKTFVPKDALELGLADKVMTPEAFYDYLAVQAEKQEGTQNTMKNKLFGNKEEMSVVDTQTELATLQGQNTELTAQLAAMTTQYTEAKELNVQLKESLDYMDTKVAECLETIAQMEKEKEDAKASLRKQKLSAVMAEEKVEGIAASLAALSDDAFETVLSGFAAQKDAVEKSSLMDEMGSSFQAQEQKEDQEPEMSSTDKAIQQRLGK